MIFCLEVQSSRQQLLKYCFMKDILLNMFSIFVFMVFTGLANILYCRHYRYWWHRSFINIHQIFFNSLLFCCVQSPSRAVYLSLLSTLLFFLLLFQITPFNCKSCEAGQLLIIWFCVPNRATIKDNKYISCWTLKSSNYLIISRSQNPPLQAQMLSSCFLLFPPLENKDANLKTVWN